MAKKKFELEFEGWEELAEQFRDLGGDTKQLTEKVLKATHEYITPKIHDKMQTSNLPAQGKYSQGDTEKQIIDEVNIEWTGTSATVDVGFSLDEGIIPIFLIYGTPSMSAAKGLKNAIYGTQTKNEVAEIQEQIFVEEIQRRLTNGE